MPPPARTQETTAAADSRRIQQALIQRFSQAPQAQQNGAAQNSSPAARNETQTLLQLQRTLTALATPARAVSPRTLVSAPQNSIGRIYTAKKSGTRAEGMALAKKTSKTQGREKSEHSKEASKHEAPPAPASSGRPRSLASLNIPRPSRALVKSAALLVSPEGASPGLQTNKTKVLTNGLTVFLGKASTRGAASAPTPLLGKLFLLYSPRAMILSPKAQTIILQLSIPPRLRVFFNGLAPSGPVWGKPMTSFMRLFAMLFRGRGGAGTNRFDRDFLNKLYRRRMRKKALDKLNKKRVRRVSSNIARAAGKTKTADLKHFY